MCILLTLLLIFSIQAPAQRVTRNYRNRSFSDVLIDLGKSTSRYKLSFIYNELEDFTVSKQITAASVPDAIKTAIGFYPIRMTVNDSLIFVECTQKEATHMIGRVVDTSRQPVAYANVTLLAPKDSAFINGGVTNENGNFVIPCKQGEVIMKITSVGYQTSIKRVRVGNVGTIKLAPEKYFLKGVTIKSRLPKTMLKGEGMTTIVAGSVLEKTMDMNQLLDRIPTVSAKDGAIEVFGRGTPLIYINNHERSTTDLQQLSPSDVKSVEVIRNPGARYPASATSVLRITTKKPVGEGFSFDSRTQIKSNDKGHWTEIERLNLTYRTSHLELNAFLYGDHSHYDQADKTMLQTTYTQDAVWRQSSRLTNEFRNTNPMAMLSASYQIDNNNSIGARLSYDRYAKQDCNYSMEAETMRDNELVDKSLATSFSPSQSTAVASNAYYEGKIGKVNIDFNTDWYWFRGTDKDFTDESFTEIGSSEELRNVSTDKLTYNSLVASKLVLTTPLAGGELSFGGEYSTSSRRSTYNVLPKDIIDDEKARIRENMASGYLDYSRSIGKLYVRAGLRYEYVDFNYFDHGVRVGEQCRTFSNLFPSLAMSTSVGDVQMQLGYANDISRPSYHNLRSGIQYDNRYTYESGNPFLLPCLSHNVNYTLSWKWLTFVASFSHIKDEINQLVQTYKDDPRMSLMRLENMPSYNSMMAAVAVSPTIGIWSPTFEVDFNKQWYNMPIVSGGLLRRPIVKFIFDNTLDTKLATFSLYMRASTTGDSGSQRLRRGSFTTDASVQRQFLKRQLTVQFYVSDLFHTGTQHFTYYSGAMRTTAFDFEAQTNFNLHIRYAFNVGRNKYRGTGAGQSQRSRM